MRLSFLGVPLSLVDTVTCVNPFRMERSGESADVAGLLYKTLHVWGLLGSSMSAPAHLKVYVGIMRCGVDTTRVGGRALALAKRRRRNPRVAMSKTRPNATPRRLGRRRRPVADECTDSRKTRAQNCKVLGVLRGRGEPS